jgi:hypothetical protein
MVEEKTEKKERKVLKSRSFKRIRGFLKGSKKKKKDDKKGEQNNATRSIGGDEESTIYGVDVDERSVVSKQTSDAKAISSMLDAANADGKEKKSFLLKVVLLLMDPETRRFELLQLEFDSLKALVSDVLAQIPVSVTEEALRKQTYTGWQGDGGSETSRRILPGERSARRDSHRYSCQGMCAIGKTNS